MWHLTIRSPLNAPLEYEVKSGKNTLGRKPDNNIVIADESASREHAEIYCQNDLAIIYDAGSLNGTFVNRERIDKPHVLQAGDQIRIGQHVITVVFLENGASPNLVAALSGTRPLTRDLLLESIDQNAVFMDTVASRLTTILDLDAGLHEISELTRIAVGAEKCEVILADHFDQFEDLELPGSILRQSVDGRSVVIIPDLLSQSDQSKSDNNPASHSFYIVCSCHYRPRCCCLDLRIQDRYHNESFRPAGYTISGNKQSSGRFDHPAREIN